MRLESRIRKLERGRGPQPCPTCGGGSGGSMKFTCSPPKVLKPGWTLADLEESARERPEDFCAACGRKRVFRIRSPFLDRRRAT